jgi:hypothetical protein
MTEKQTVMDEKTSVVDYVEKPTGDAQQIESNFLTAAQIQHRFDTLRELSDEQMAALNKKVVRKIDWRLMPCITLMFLMK